MKKDQVRTLLKAFAEGKKIGQLEAIVVYGIGHLSSLVSKMILEWECPVIKEWETSETGSRYVVYSMSKAEAQKWLDETLAERRGY